MFTVQSTSVIKISLYRVHCLACVRLSNHRVGLNCTTDRFESRQFELFKQPGRRLNWMIQKGFNHIFALLVKQTNLAYQHKYSVVRMFRCNWENPQYVSERNIGVMSWLNLSNFLIFRLLVIIIIVVSYVQIFLLKFPWSLLFHHLER